MLSLSARAYDKPPQREVDLLGVIQSHILVAGPNQHARFVISKAQSRRSCVSFVPLHLHGAEESFVSVVMVAVPADRIWVITCKSRRVAWLLTNCSHRPANIRLYITVLCTSASILIYAFV